MHPETIIISRTDSIGDVILTLPLAGILKKKFPDCKILFLGKKYTEAIIKLSMFVDQFLNWDEIASIKDEVAENFFRQTGADTIIHVFPRKEIASLAKRAGIKNRIGTSHRLWHLSSCNHRPSFTRKRSDLHEAQLNIKLLSPLGIEEIPALNDIPDLYGFRPPEFTSFSLEKDYFNLILHPGSKGSAREWGLDNFRKLCELLGKDSFRIFLTGTEEEGKLFRDHFQDTGDHVIDVSGKFSLNELISFINQADGLVACSTGPLHIAAALKTFCIGLFPPIRPMHPGRWAPLGENAHVMVKDKICEDCRKKGDCHCIKDISAEEVAEKIITCHKG